MEGREVAVEQEGARRNKVRGGLVLTKNIPSRLHSKRVDFLFLEDSKFKLLKNWEKTIQVPRNSPVSFRSSKMMFRFFAGKSGLTLRRSGPLTSP